MKLQVNNFEVVSVTVVLTVIYLCVLQEERTPWEDLPEDVLVQIAGGKELLKGMRGVCSTWKRGFESSATHLRIEVKIFYLCMALPALVQDQSSWAQIGRG